MQTKEDDYQGNVVIPSKVITDDYLKLVLPFSGKIEDRIFEFDECLRPENDRRGLKSKIEFSSNGGDRLTRRKRKDSIRKKYIDVFNVIYSFKIDSLDFDSEFILTKDKGDHLGFETYLNLVSLSEGKHNLKLILELISNF